MSQHRGRKRTREEMESSSGSQTQSESSQEIESNSGSQTLSQSPSRRQPNSNAIHSYNESALKRQRLNDGNHNNMNNRNNRDWPNWMKKNIDVTVERDDDIYLAKVKESVHILCFGKIMDDAQTI